MICQNLFFVAALVVHVGLARCCEAQYEVSNKVVLIHDRNLAEPGGEAAKVYEGNIVQVRAIDGSRLHVKIGSVIGWLDSTDVVSLSEGVAHFTKLVEENANDGKARRCRAWAWLELGEHEKALADLNASIVLEPNNTRAYYERGRYWMETCEYDKAIADYDDAIRLDMESADAYCSRGTACGLKGDNDRAISDFDRAIRLKPRMASAYLGRGCSWYDQGKYEKAMADFEEAITLDPSDALVRYNRGQTWVKKGEFDKAMADYDEAIRLDSECADAYRGRGNAWQHKGECDKAIAAYSKAIQLDRRDALAYYNRGVAWYQKRDYDRAIADYTIALGIQPTNVSAYFNRGIAWEAKGDYENAIADIHEAIRLGSDERERDRYRSVLTDVLELSRAHSATAKPQEHGPAESDKFVTNNDENAIPVHLLASGAVQTELGLTVEQMAKINEMVQFAKKQLRETADIWQEMHAGSTGPLSEARGQELKEWIIGAATKGKELQATAVGSLTPSQHARLRQIQTQYAMAIVLLQPSLIQSLSISDAQLDTIRPHARELVLANADLVKGWGIPKDELERIRPPSKLVAERGLAELLAFDGLSSQKILARMIDHTKEREKAMAEANRLALEALTVEQRTKLEEFVGKQIEINWDYDALFRGD